MSSARIKKKMNLTSSAIKKNATSGEIDWQKLVENEYGLDIRPERESSFTNWEAYYKKSILSNFKRTMAAVAFFTNNNLPLPDSLESKMDGFLNIAAQHGYEVWFKQAEKNGIHAGGTSWQDIGRLVIAINYGFVRVVTFLMEKKGEALKEVLLDDNNPYQKNALQVSAQTQIDDPVFLKMMINIYGNEIINQPLNEKGLTLLHYASLRGNAVCLEYLIKKGANVNQKATWENQELTAQEMLWRKGYFNCPGYDACMKVFEAEKVRCLDDDYLEIKSLFSEKPVPDAEESLQSMSNPFTRFLI